MINSAIIIYDVSMSNNAGWKRILFHQIYISTASITAEMILFHLPVFPDNELPLDPNND